jgi:predicted lactoylglutathione lyase
VFDHVTVRASDRYVTEDFFLTVLPVLGIQQDFSGPEFAEWQDFSVAQAADDDRVTRRVHVAFAAPTREHADAFWRAGTDAGYRSDGEPGPRPEYGDDYYGAFLLDPDGNSVEAVHHDTMRMGRVVGNTWVPAGGIIDHLWLRVADLAAARDFYATVAPWAAYELTYEEPGRARFAGTQGSFSVVAGDEPTENLHIAFPAPDHETVQGFHGAAVGAGFRDNGAPAERPVYHPGYYAAFVLDPDGNNVELVMHGRGPRYDE